MPNWTYNRITCKRELAEKLLTKTDDKYIFDFNKLIPMPNTLHLVAGSTEDEAIASYYLSLKKLEQKALKELLQSKEVFYYGDYWNKYERYIKDFKTGKMSLSKCKKKFKKDKQEDNYKKFRSLKGLGKQYIDNIMQYGFAQWYDWRNENWGTKWNVNDQCDVIIDESTDTFEIIFNTAWSIPSGIFQKFFDYCEDGEFNWVYEDEDYDGTHTLTKENGNVVDMIEYEKYEDETFEEYDEVLPERIQAETLPTGWIWVKYEDRSGHLESPEGKSYMIYDLDTKEYKIDEDGSWNCYIEGWNIVPYSSEEIKKYDQDFFKEAERMIKTFGLIKEEEVVEL